MDGFDRKDEVEADSVLRGADVIPPFDSMVRRSSDYSAGMERRVSLPSATGDAGGRSGTERVGRAGSAGEGLTGDLVGEAGPPSGGRVDVPQFDLAENILAEQRRLNARRRKGPGRSEEEKTKPADVDRPMGPAAWPADVQELHHVVADIVARDIERLCKSERAFVGRAMENGARG